MASKLRLYWETSWKVCAFLVIWALLMAPFSVPFGSFLAEWEKTSPLQARIYFSSVSAATVLVATALATRFFDRRSFHSVGLQLNGFWRQGTTGLLCGVLWLSIAIGGLWIADCVVLGATGEFSVLVLFGAVLDVFLNVLTQQLLLCGYIFQLLRRATSTWLAISISALLFVGYHAGAYAGAELPVLNVFLTGVLFCLATVVANSLWLPIFMHFGWNFMLGPVLGLAISASNHFSSGWQLLKVSGPELLTGGKFGLEGGVTTTLATSIIIAVIAMIGRQQSLRASRINALIEEPR
jgi:membrane protease YdiL (CAAX protease family)